MAEDDSSRVRQWLGAGPAATSRLSAVEIASALVRRCREGVFSVAERDRALAALGEDFSALHVVELSPRIVVQAQALLLRHILRTGDAIQLASALLLRDELRERIGFAAYDDRLKMAAKAEALAVLS